MNDELDKIELSSQLNERRDVYILRNFNSLNHTLRREVANDNESVWSVYTNFIFNFTIWFWIIIRWYHIIVTKRVEIDPNSL